MTKTETINGTVTAWTYGYDVAGRLTDVLNNGSVYAHYDYDANGNRLDKTNGAGTVLAAGTYDAQDRMLSYGNNTYSYTANGELTAKTNSATGETTTYQYDVLGNLKHVNLPDGTAIDYVVDGRNRRIGKKVNGALTQAWLYDGQLRPIAEMDGSGAVVSRFVYATHINVPDYVIKGTTTYKIITDHLGSPRFVIDAASGVIAQRLDYDEFGNVLLDTNPGFQSFGFAGGIYDSQTKLVRFGARDYDPETGRWTSKDPIGFGGGQTGLYSYASNSPLQFVDYSGLDIWIEGPSPGEPAGHMSINVGDPNGAYDSYSFGKTPESWEGEVYRDTDKGGDFYQDYYLKTTPEEDQEAKGLLESMAGMREPYRPWRTCRNFSVDTFRLFENLKYGKRGAPPPRKRSPNTPSTTPPLVARPTLTGP